METLFVSYLYGFVLLRPIIVAYSDKATLILLAMVVGSLLWFFFLFQGSFPSSCLVPWVIITVSGMFFISKGMHDTGLSDIAQYRTNFIIYAVVPLFYLMFVDDFKMILKRYCQLSIPATLIVILDPLNKYYLSTNYMIYGGYLVNYSLIGLLIGVFYFRKKKMWIPLLGVMGMIVMYANKGSVIAAVALVLSCILYSGKTTVRRVCLLLVLSVIAVFWKEILLFLIDLSESMGIESYSMETFRIMLGKNANYVYSQRTDLWDGAMVMIERSPFVGSGVGAFERRYGIYPHNLFLEITVTFGVIGLILFAIFLINAILYWKNCDSIELKMFQAGVFISMLIRLQFSDTFWAVPFFWICWGIYLYHRLDFGWGRVHQR